MPILCLQVFPCEAARAQGRQAVPKRKAGVLRACRPPRASKCCNGFCLPVTGQDQGSGPLTRRALQAAWAADSLWAMRSSSAQTSAMRPERTMRPAYEGLTPASNSRTIFSRRGDVALATVWQGLWPAKDAWGALGALALRATGHSPLG